MKVLSLLQPWATLVVIGAKKIETRSWNTKHRGDLLIHASMGKYYGPKGNRVSCELITEDFNDRLKANIGPFKNLPFGSIIGKVTLVNTVKITSIKTEYDPADDKMLQGPGRFTVPPAEPEFSYGDYTEGRYAWLLKDAVKFDEPIQQTGGLSVWNFPMCRKCGCWEEVACIHPTHGNCYWATEDLCSNCANHPGEATRYSKLIKQPVSSSS